MLCRRIIQSVASAGSKRTATGAAAAATTTTTSTFGWLVDSTHHSRTSSVRCQAFSTANRSSDDDDETNQNQNQNQAVSWEKSLHSELPHSSKPLGSPLPFDEHACSVSLPTWSSVVGYEEGDQEVVAAMNCGYPRFVFHPYILQLMQVFLDRFSSPAQKEDCLVLPTREAALRCQAFLQESLEQNNRTAATLGSPAPPRPVDNALFGHQQLTDTTSDSDNQTSPSSPSSSSRIRVAALEEADVYAVLFPAETAAGIGAKAYWQHTGELVSSRRAEKALLTLGQTFSKRVTCCPVEGTPTIFHPSDVSASSSSSSTDAPQMTTTTATTTTTSPSSPTASSPYQKLKERIASWTNVGTENIFLLPSGMATIYKSLRSARRYQLEKYPSSRGGASIVYGFPYLDTLKMCSRQELSPAGVEFFGKGDATDLHNLERLLQQHKKTRRWSALMTEVPSNPLLQCPDLDGLRALADEHDFCLVVDDTIGNFLNVDLIESGMADAVCTSLTKIVSGRGDAIAGSVVLNPYTEKGRWMRDDMAKDTDTHGGLHEADARAMVHNSRDFPERNGRINETAERLAEYLLDHPGVEKVWYPKFVAPLFKKYQKGKGYGGLLSIHLHPHICQRTFYDTLDVAKGPSLGTNFTLVCPYTLLAHYHELDFAMSYNVPPNLIRIAVGLEDFDDLKEKFDYALNKSRLHPKLPPNPPQ